MICDDCVYLGRPSYAYPCCKCDMKEWSPLCMYERKQKSTNADRIRAMSDEELTSFVRAILRMEDCPIVMGSHNCAECFFKQLCYNQEKYLGCELKWLQQIVEE